MRIFTSILILLVLLSVGGYGQDDGNSIQDEYIGPALKLSNEGKYEDGVTLLSAGIQKHPTNVVLYFRRGELYWHSGKGELILPDVESAIRLSPDKYNASIRGGVLLANARRCSESYEILSKAIAMDPSKPGAFGSRASANLCKDDKIAALNDIDLAISLGQNDPPTISFRRDLLASIGGGKSDSESDDDLIARAESAYKASPNDKRLQIQLSMLHEKRARKLEKEDKIDEMFAEYDRIVDVFPDARSYQLRGLKHYEYNEYELALEDLTKAIELSPNMPFYFAYRADIYLKMNNFDKAIEDLETAIGFKSKMNKYLIPKLAKAKAEREGRKVNGKW